MDERSNDHADRIAATITKAAKLMDAPAILEETLDAIVRATVETVPGFDHVGISLTHRGGRIETMSVTDQLVWDLDEVQYGLSEGPCYDSIRGASVTVVEHAAQDQRWPSCMPQAVQRGLRSQLAVGLYRDEQSVG